MLSSTYIRAENVTNYMSHRTPLLCGQRCFNIVDCCAASVPSEALNFYQYIIDNNLSSEHGGDDAPLKIHSDSSTFVCILCIIFLVKESSIIADFFLVFCQKMSFINMPDDDTDFV